MADRAYSTTDYQACRYLVESGNSAAVATTGLTDKVVDRLQLLNLVNGVPGTTAIGDIVRLAGLGVKTGEEAIRLGIAAMIPTAMAAPNPVKQAADVC